MNGSINEAKLSFPPRFCPMGTWRPGSLPHFLMGHLKTKQNETNPKSNEQPNFSTDCNNTQQCTAGFPYSWGISVFILCLAVCVSQYLQEIKHYSDLTSARFIWDLSRTWKKKMFKNCVSACLSTVITLGSFEIN